MAWWQAAASGTPDTPADCNLESDGQRSGADTAACESRWGTVNQSGNLSEWTAWWAIAGRSWIDDNNPEGGVHPWPPGFGDDAVFNVGGRVFLRGQWQDGLPSAVLRGGNFQDGTDAGIFNMDLLDAPHNYTRRIGMRCCRAN